jgi:hypothetical protein
MKMTEEQIILCRKATANAKLVLKSGDKIRVSRCGGIRATYVFSHWDGNWAVSKSGIDDLSANSIDRLNGKPVNFAEMNLATCKHENFRTDVRVARLTDTGRFVADIRIHCVDCGIPMQFKGVAAGYNADGAAVSIDGLELRIGICPQGAEPNPLQVIMGVTKKYFN